MSLSNSCVLIFPSNYCTPSPLMTPSSIPWRRFPVLDARLCQMKSFWWRLFSFFSFFLVFLCACGHLSKLQFPVHEYADGRPKQCSACTIFLLRRSWRIACTRNRLSKQIFKHSRRLSTSIFLGSLTTKGRYRKATLANAILQRPFQGIHHATIIDNKTTRSTDFLFQANPWIHVFETKIYN